MRLEQLKTTPLPTIVARILARALDYRSLKNHPDLPQLAK